MGNSYSKQADWLKLPAGFSFRMVNNIAEDSTGRIYCSKLRKMKTPSWVPKSQ